MQDDERGDVLERYAGLELEVEQLRAALRNRDLIGMAKGIVIAEQHCSPDEAFDYLRRHSQNSNRKLVDVAAQLVASRGGGALAPPRPGRTMAPPPSMPADSD